MAITSPRPADTNPFPPPPLAAGAVAAAFFLDAADVRAFFPECGRAFLELGFLLFALLLTLAALEFLAPLLEWEAAEPDAGAGAAIWAVDADDACAAACAAFFAARAFCCALACALARCAACCAATRDAVMACSTDAGPTLARRDRCSMRPAACFWRFATSLCNASMSRMSWRSFECSSTTRWAQQPMHTPRVRCGAVRGGEVVSVGKRASDITHLGRHWHRPHAELREHLLHFLLGTAADAR